MCRIFMVDIVANCISEAYLPVSLPFGVAATAEIAFNK